MIFDTSKSELREVYPLQTEETAFILPTTVDLFEYCNPYLSLFKKAQLSEPLRVIEEGIPFGLLDICSIMSGTFFEESIKTYKACLTPTARPATPPPR